MIVVYTGQSAQTSTQPQSQHPAPAQPSAPCVSSSFWVDEQLLPRHSLSSAAVSVPVFHAAAPITPAAAAVVPPVQPATAPDMSQLAEQMPITPAAAVPPPVPPTTAPVMSQLAEQMMPERMEVDAESSQTTPH